MGKTRKRRSGRAKAKRTQPASKKTQLASSQNRWTKERITVLVTLITVIGGIAGTACANFDKIIPRDKLNVSETDTRLALYGQRRTFSMGLLTDAEVKVDEGMDAVWDNNQLSPEEKAATAEVARKIKEVVRTEKTSVEKDYDRLEEAIRANDNVKSDIIQRDLNQKILNLQREVDQRMEGTKLKKVIPPIVFGHLYEDEGNGGTSAALGSLFLVTPENRLDSQLVH